MIWCQHCDDNSSPAVREGLLCCGICNRGLVRKKEGCVVCGYDAKYGFGCDGCGQRCCGRHIIKRSVHGFSVWCCPYCFARSEEKWHKEKYSNGYGDYTFVYSRRLGHYIWDGFYNPRNCRTCGQDLPRKICYRCNDRGDQRKITMGHYCCVDMYEFHIDRDIFNLKELPTRKVKDYYIMKNPVYDAWGDPNGRGYSLLACPWCGYKDLKNLFIYAQGKIRYE